tara:strand:+ start:43 stop:507 length:465 start_codon:yes stop_codon:yes gene_type:complete
MIFFKNIILFLILFFLSFQNVFADNHDANKKVLEEAKKINEEINSLEEDVPLNDPFAGDAAGVETSIEEENVGEKSNSILYRMKLVGIVSGEKEHYIALANTSGDVIILKLFEDIEDGTKLVDLRLSEAIFQRAEDKKYIIINFNNRVVEKDEY